MNAPDPRLGRAKADLDTPALLVDLDILEANIRRIAETCAKHGEAEIMAAAGFRDILIANQIVGRLKVNRLFDLAGRADLIVAVDGIENVRELAAEARTRGP